MFCGKSGKIPVRPIFKGDFRSQTANTMTNDNFQYEQQTPTYNDLNQQKAHVSYVNDHDQLKPGPPSEIDQNKPKIYPSDKDTGFYAIMGSILVLYIVLNVFLFIVYLWSGVIMLITTIFVFVLIFCLIPRQIEVWNDSVKIRYYPMYAMTIPFDDILGLEIMGPCDIGFAGCKFGTNLTSEKVAIHRKVGCCDVLITPKDPREFVSYVRYRMNPSSFMHPPAHYV